MPTEKPRYTVIVDEKILKTFLIELFIFSFYVIDNISFVYDIYVK